MVVYWESMMVGYLDHHLALHLALHLDMLMDHLMEMYWDHSMV